MSRLVKVKFTAPAEMVGGPETTRSLHIRPDRITAANLHRIFGIPEGMLLLLEVQSEGGAVETVMEEDWEAAVSGLDEVVLRIGPGNAGLNPGPVGQSPGFGARGQAPLGAFMEPQGVAPFAPPNGVPVPPPLIPGARAGPGVPVSVRGGRGGRGRHGVPSSVVAAARRRGRSSSRPRLGVRAVPEGVLEGEEGLMEGLLGDDDEEEEEEVVRISIVKGYLHGTRLHKVIKLSDRRNVAVPLAELDLPGVTKAVCEAFGGAYTVCDSHGSVIPDDDFTKEEAYWRSGLNARKLVAVPAKQVAKRKVEEEETATMLAEGQSLTKRPKLALLVKLKKENKTLLLELCKPVIEGSVVDAAAEATMCSICRNTASSPTLCRCKCIVGCATCLRRFWDENDLKESPENLMARCPLCHQLWVDDQGNGGVEVAGLSELRSSLIASTSVTRRSALSANIANLSTDSE